MSFTPINPLDFNGKGARSLPNQPAIPADALKAKFDEPSTDVIAPAFNRLIGELEDSSAASSLGAVAPTGRTVATQTVQAGLNVLSSDLATLEDAAGTAIQDAHTHDNKANLDKFSEDSSGKPLYDGNPIGETDYDNLQNLPSINGVTLSGAKTSSDLGINIPTNLSDLAEDSTHRVVTDAEKTDWDAKLSDAIKKITVSGTSIEASGEQEVELAAGSNVTIVANTSVTPPKITISSTGGGGGGGGGDMYKSEYATNGTSGVVDKAQTLEGLNVSVSDLNGLTSKYYATTDSAETDLDDADYVPFFDMSVATKKRTLWSNIKAKLKTYFDGIYSTVSDIDDLGDVNIDTSTLAQDQVLKYDGTEWVNGNAGHAMLANNTYINSLRACALDDTNATVASGYAIGNWSNASITTIIAHVDKDDDTIGVWNDDWESTTVRTGWIWHKDLYNVVGDDEVEISIVFDVAGREVVVLYAYRVDDEVYYAVSNPSGNPQEQGWYELSGSTYVLTTDTSVVVGKTYYIVGGAIAIKLFTPIQNDNGVNVAVNLKRQRTNKVNATYIS